MADPSNKNAATECFPVRQKQKGGKTALHILMICRLSENLEVLRHGPAEAPFEVECNQLPFFELVDTRPAQSRNLNEDVLAVLRFDRADTTACIKPFNVSMQHGLLLSFSIN